MTAITLTKCQEAAYAAIIKLITDPSQRVLVIEGGAGTGKTTLLDTVLNEWETTVKLTAGAFKDTPIYLTATTNKASDALSQATGRPVVTINSLLGLRVRNVGFKKSVIDDSGARTLTDSIIIIDEISFISSELWAAIIKYTSNCKFILLGDPYQLPPVGEKDSSLFSMGFNTVTMSEIKRQGDQSPIKTLSRNLRELVRTEGDMPKAGVDGVNILHMDNAAFLNEIKNTFSNSKNSRVLTWTNDRAKFYNQYVSNALSGSDDFTIGDTVVLSRTYSKGSGLDGYRYPADSTMTVKHISNWFKDKYGITCRFITNQNNHKLIEAAEISEVNGALKEAYANGDIGLATILENRYADIRHPYGATVNKSQGSTYDTVFIDLNDIGRCKDLSLKYRLLYVAASRARDRIVFTGDI